MSRIERQRPRKNRWLVPLLVLAGFLVFVGANAHFVWVAVQSQPDCVEHVKVAGDGAGFRAAKSAC